MRKPRWQTGVDGKNVAMTTTNLPTLDLLKGQARRLRESLAATGRPVTHGKALELIAGQYGFRDWNTLCVRAAAQASAPRPELRLDMQVSGHYLGVPFTGRIAALGRRGGRFLRLTVVFDAPVDVSRFSSFAVKRRRISATIDLETGETVEKTSDGRPQLVVHLAA